MTKPVVIVASLMRFEGATGVQSHMGEFVRYLKTVDAAYEVATPFHWLTSPLLVLLVLLRKLLERSFQGAAVRVYRDGHAFLLACRLLWLMQRHPQCVVYAQCPVSAAVAMRFAIRPAQRVALVVHFNVSQAEEWIGKGMICPGSAQDKSIRRLEADVVRSVDGLVFVSRFMQSELKRVWPDLDQGRVEIIPNFVRSLADTAPMQNMVGRDLVCIGTLEPRKNQAFLLSVLREANQRGRRLTLTLVGDGPDRGSLERLVVEHGLSGQVFFEGFSPQGRLFIPGHKLYVHAAQMENLPVVLLEALSAGVPVVAAKVGGIPEVFEDGVQGRFWSLDDPAEACGVLLGLLDDEEARLAMGRAAWRQFEQRFDVSVVARRLHGYLISLSS